MRVSFRTMIIRSTTNIKQWKGADVYACGILDVYKTCSLVMYVESVADPGVLKGGFHCYEL